MGSGDEFNEATPPAPKPAPVQVSALGDFPQELFTGDAAKLLRCLWEHVEELQSALREHGIVVDKCKDDDSESDGA